MEIWSTEVEDRGQFYPLITKPIWNQFNRRTVAAKSLVYVAAGVPSVYLVPPPTPRGTARPICMVYANINMDTTAAINKTGAGRAEVITREVINIRARCKNSEEINGSVSTSSFLVMHTLD